MTRLVVVSNRVAPVVEGKATAGGLAVAVLEALRDSGGLWFGWSGDTSEDQTRPPRLVEQGPLTIATIDLTRQQLDGYYRGYANGTLWPLFHYRTDLVEHRRSQYADYRAVNARFARQLVPLIGEDDLIWVHDYHLIMLGPELRRHGLGNRMGFFLHTPFPPPDVLLTCSDHAAIVDSLCTYDLIGFQTDHDRDNFIGYIERIAGGTVRRQRYVDALGRRFQIGAFPIGVHPEPLAKAAAKAERARPTIRLVRSLDARALMIGVDRLDYSKGLDVRFLAYETLLERRPEHRGAVTFMEIAPPSRGDVATYREIRGRLEGLAGHINGRFAEFDWVPLRYLNKSFDRGTLMGFLRSARVAVVTPLRDGMNLVAKEFVAAQNPEDPGALVLSQFAGAARELDAAVLVNPYDVEAIADGMHRALTMPRQERQERWTSMIDVLQRNNLEVWRRSFLKTLAAAPLRSAA